MKRVRWFVAAAVAVVVAAALVPACSPHPVGPARTFRAYEGKATTTAESALSAVATVRLAARTGAAGDGFGPYLSVLVSDQEASLSGVQGTFGSIQPPGERADRLRNELDDLLQQALAGVADVRIALRRGQLDRLDVVAAPLADAADGLEAFTEAHG